MTNEETERLIVQRIVNDAIIQGYAITVRDGSDGELVLIASQEAGVVLAAMFSTSDDLLTFYKGGKRAGFIHFIYGNGDAVVSDCSAADAIDEILAGSDVLIHDLQATAR